MRAALVLLTVVLAACSGAPGSDAAPGGDDGDDGVVTCARDDATAPPTVAMPPPVRFQVIGDVHGHAPGNPSNANIVGALADLRAIGPTARALVINGDLTEHGYLDEYSGLTQSLAGGSAPRLWNIGNHDYHGTNSSAVERQRFLDYAGRSTVWFEHAIEGYPFLLLGGEHGDQASWGPGSMFAWYAVLSDAQLDWLDARLTATEAPHRPQFVFLHQGTWDTTNQARLEQILRTHPNAIYFWSHYHRDLHSTGVDGTLYTTSRGFRQVHTGSIQYTWDNATPNRRHDEWFQGVQVDVFADRVQIRGRDFAARAWIPQFEFQLEQRPPAQLGAAALDAAGRLVVIAASPDGKAVRATQPEPGAKHLAFGDAGGTVTSAPALAANRDGRLEAFALGSDGALWHSTQDLSGAWSAWASLGGALTSNVAVGRNLDGTLEVFARGTDHALWHTWQTAPGAGTWAAWRSLGGVITSDVAVIDNPDGRLEVFTRGDDSSLAHIWQVAPMGAWSPWAGLGGTLISKLAVARRADGAIEVFGLGTGGDLFHIWQTSAGWSPWTSLGGGFASHPVVAATADGRLEVFVRGNDAALYHRAEQATEWAPWASLGGELDSDAIVARNQDGRLELFGRGTDGALWTNRQQSPGACWSGWSPLATPVATF